MKIEMNRNRSRRSWSGLVSASLGVATVAGLMLTLAGPASAATAAGLGTATSFAVLGGSTVTNTGPSVINGDLGVSPGSAVVGFPPGIVNGTIHAADAVAAQAQSDTTTAYNDLAGQPCDTNLTDQDLGGLTLTTGVYCFDTSAQLTGDLTLDAEGNPDAVFIFQIGSTLTTASGSGVNLINGAQPCNVFWQVGSSATLGTTTDFVGNLIALTSITANTGATVQGRLLARNGATTLDTNVITLATCDAETTTGETTGGLTTGMTTTGETTGVTTGGLTTGLTTGGETTGVTTGGITTGLTTGGETTGVTTGGITTGVTTGGETTGVTTGGITTGVTTGGVTTGLTTGLTTGGITTGVTTGAPTTGDTGGGHTTGDTTGGHDHEDTGGHKSDEDEDTTGGHKSEDSDHDDESRGDSGEDSGEDSGADHGDHDGDQYGQVELVPVGGVDTGDGSTVGTAVAPHSG